MACYRAPVAPRTRLNEPFEAPVSPRTRVGIYEAPIAPRTRLAGVYEAPLQAMSRTFASQTFRDVYVAPVDTAVRYKPQVYPRLYLGTSTEITSFLSSIEIIWPRNGTLLWRAELAHHVNRMLVHPGHLVPPGSGSYANQVLPHKQDQTRFLTLTFTGAGETEEYPRLLAADPVTDGSLVRWGGTDMTPLLELEGQAMADLISDGGTRMMAHAAMSQIGTAYAVKILPGFPDYMIRELHRASGSPISWLDRIARPYQAARRWEKQSLLYEQAQFNPDATTGHWHYIDRLTIHQLDLRSNADSVRNSFRVTRLEPIKKILGEQECVGPQCVGRSGNMTIDPPSKYVAFQWHTANGSLENVTGFDENGDVAGHNAGTMKVLQATRAPIARVEFTLKPAIQNKAYTPRYEVVAIGGAQPSSGNFDFPVEDARSIADIGERPERTNQEDAIIPNGAVAAAYAAALLAESVRRTWVAVFRSPFINPLLRPGHTIVITDRLTNQATRAWFVEQVTLRWNRNGGSYQEIQAVRPWL